MHAWLAKDQSFPALSPLNFILESPGLSFLDHSDILKEIKTLGFVLIILISFLNFSLCICPCVLFVFMVPERSEKASDPLNLEL